MDTVNEQETEYLFCEEYHNNQMILTEMDKEYQINEALEEVLSL